MALPSTVFKADLQIADTHRHYYDNHSLTFTRHPSETNERLMVRLLAFALNASQGLVFAQGLTDSDEPDLWEKDATGAIINWIFVGLPDEKKIKKACSRSEKVIIYAYGGSTVGIWHAGLNIDKFSNLSIWNVPPTDSQALVNTVERSMKIQCSIDDSTVWWSSLNTTIEINLARLK